MKNISLSAYERGADIAISCAVETCIPDMVMQVFKEDQLIEMTTVQEGNIFKGTTQIKATEEVVGNYICQGMSEGHNKVFRKSFSISAGI